MKRLAALLVLGCITTSFHAQTDKTHTLAGYISDSKCGALHMDNGVSCVKKCIENGNRPVLVDAQKTVWSIENPELVKDYYGDNVQIVAVIDPESRSVRIYKVRKTGGVMGGMKDGMQ